MNNFLRMTGKLKILATTFVLAVVFTLVPISGTHAAPPDLEVQFENTPLFSEANFAPGNTVTRFVQVTNNTNGQKPVQAEAISVVDTDSLSLQIHFQITQGATTIFDGTLKEFFDKKETPLSNIPGNSTLVYDFAATFNPAAGNSFQNKTVSFDLLVGFQGQVQGGGRSSGSVISRLAIIESTVSPSPQSSDTVQINWSTTAVSTSRVVYSAANEPHTLSLTDPNRGYAHTSPEISGLVINHTLSLSGLLPNTTYFYRVLSHNSLQALSLEHSFTTPAVGTVAGASTNIPNNRSGSNGKPTAVGKAVISTGRVLGETTENNDNQTGSTPNNQNPETLINGANPQMPTANILIFLIILIILGILIYLLYKRRSRE